MGDYVKLDQLKGSAIVYTKRFSDEAVVVLQFGSEPLHLDLSDWSDQKLELVRKQRTLIARRVCSRSPLTRRLSGFPKSSYLLFI